MTQPHILAGITPGPWTYHRLTPQSKTFVIYRTNAPYSHVATMQDVSEGTQLVNAKLVSLLPEMFDSFVKIVRVYYTNVNDDPDYVDHLINEAKNIINQINPLIL